MANKSKTIAIILEENDIKIVKQAARSNGNASMSAAARMIIREWKELQSIKPDITTVKLTEKGEALAVT